jgi:hypothetical protein
MKVRRVVTSRDSAGRSVFASDADAPMAHDFQHIPGMAVANLWRTNSECDIPRQVVDPTPQTPSLVPGPGGTQLLYVVFPPDSVMASPSFDPAAAVAENLKLAPGIAERFEPDHPGMHTTPTIDYGIVLQGEIWLELDAGVVKHLRQHDVVIQHGTRHAWRNRGNAPALVAFVLIGARGA